MTCVTDSIVVTYARASADHEAVIATAVDRGETVLVVAPDQARASEILVRTADLLPGRVLWLTRSYGRQSLTTTSGGRLRCLTAHEAGHSARGIRADRIHVEVELDDRLRAALMPRLAGSQERRQ